MRSSKRGTNPETQLSAAIHDAVMASGLAILWRNNSGGVRGTSIRYGLCPGSADRVGMLVPSGRFLGLEIKMPGKDLDPDQVRWRGVVERAGGMFVVAHSVEEALSALRAAR